MTNLRLMRVIWNVYEVTNSGAIPENIILATVIAMFLSNGLRAGGEGEERTTSRPDCVSHAQGLIHDLVSEIIKRLPVITAHHTTATSK